MADRREADSGNKLVRGVVNSAKTVTGIRMKQQSQKSTRAARPKLLVSIVNREDKLQLKEVLDDCSIALAFTFAGTGTAHSAVLDYLGIGQTEKSIMVSIIPETDEAIILREIKHKMSLYHVGKGISFTIPLSGISEIVAKSLTGAATEKTLDGRKLMTNEQRKYDLIVAAVAVNHVDIAMEAARAAGAAGGTIIRARSTSNAKAEQFIGIKLMQEQELLLVLAKRENKFAIMQALNEKVGLKTDARGVIFSLPVDKTAGISAVDREEKNKEKHG